VTAYSKQPTQRNVLRYIDLAYLGLVLGYLFVSNSFFLAESTPLFIAGITELALGTVILVFALRMKTQLKHQGLWQKLTFKQTLDLHEWRHIK
jgi:hypothetical protein